MFFMLVKKSIFGQKIVLFCQKSQKRSWNRKSFQKSRKNGQKILVIFSKKSYLRSNIFCKKVNITVKYFFVKKSILRLNKSFFGQQIIKGQKIKQVFKKVIKTVKKSFIFSKKVIFTVKYFFGQKSHKKVKKSKKFSKKS